jgi:uncharacterized repeat protein (TIGR03803 family)
MMKSRLSTFVAVMMMLGAAMTMPSQAQILNTVLSFNGTNGYHPDSSLIQASDGNFYGVTQNGANTNQLCTSGGCGTVFKITPSGTLTTLYQFCTLTSCTDGANPYGSLVQGTDGNFYGTTIYGGANNNGTVFKITPTGTLTTLHSFALISDGAYPWAGLIQASDGNFYGTTTAGGIHIFGTVFKITPAGALTDLYNFCSQASCTDGANPYAPLVQGTDGNLYGTTTQGGNTTYVGTVFKITTSGSLTTIHTFCTLQHCADGEQPFARLIQAHDGNFYGTTTSGHGENAGTVFKITSSGTLTTLYTFCALLNCTDGKNPYGGVIQAADGNFYGTTNIGGTGQGTIFKLSSSGTLTTLYTFSGPDGALPYSGLLQASDGNFYGTTHIGGTHNDGTVFGLLATNSNPVQLVPITPCRLVDTRTQNGGGGPIQGNTYQTFNLPQLSQSKGCGDLSSATTFSLNVTLIPVNGIPVSYLTIWPAGENRPVVSTMNSLDGRIKANAAIVPAGLNGGVSVFVTEPADVVLDIDGYFATASGSTLAFHPLTPCRVADTRSNQFPQGLGTPHLSGTVARDFPVLNSSCIPSGVNAAAYSFNFTAVPYPSLGHALGYLEVWPTDHQPAHPVSTLNNLTGTYVANAAIVPAGTAGKITVLGSNDTDLAIDINGYFSDTGSGGLSLYPAVPCRVFDSRQGGGQPFSGTLNPPVDVANSPCGVSGSAQAYVFNATVVPSPTLTYLTLWPDGETQPVVSTLNAVDGWITSNMAIVPTTNGKIDAYASGTTHLVLDIFSYFAP